MWKPPEANKKRPRTDWVVVMAAFLLGQTTRQLLPGAKPSVNLTVSIISAVLFLTICSALWAAPRSD
jgi:hypothetical protein